MHVEFTSGDCRLQGILTAPAEPQGGAVICHPHPLYGGNMNNPIVRALEDGLQRAERATLRFNFRGVGESTGSYTGGSGEGEDLRAAIRHLTEALSIDRVTLAGYSFGAMVILQVGPGLEIVDRLIAVAPPLSFFTLENLAHCQKPMLFLAGYRDQYCDVAELERQVAALGESKQQRVLRGADHFLFGNEPDVAWAVADFLL
jgi:alpha/beta superfamily hydrolase